MKWQPLITLGQPGPSLYSVQILERPLHSLGQGRLQRVWSVLQKVDPGRYCGSYDALLSYVTFQLNENWNTEHSKCFSLVRYILEGPHCLLVSQNPILYRV